MSKNEKIIKYRRGFNFDIGFFIFIIIIIYVLYHLFSYIISSPIAEYEVHQGTIATNNVYHGLIIRDETVEYASASGSINYFAVNNSKVSVNDVIYSIDSTGKISDKINSAVEDGEVLNPQAVSSIEEQISGFVNSYDGVNFSNVYTFKQRLSSELSQTLSTQALSTLDGEVSEAVSNSTFQTNKSTVPGVISYAVDGYEDVNTDNFNAENLNGIGYQKTNLYENKTVEKNAPVYKRVNSEAWNILIAIPDNLATRLADEKAIKIRFIEDDFTQNVSFSIIKKEKRSYLNLNLKSAMIRYINNRFIDVELVLNNDSGLKIPISSITSKDFYTIPKEYFSVGGSSNNLGIMVQDANSVDNTVHFVEPTIYYENDEYYYTDAEDIKTGDVLIKTDSKSKYIIGSDISSLKGVYNINKGYAVFKQINILSQNDDYAIVETKTQYGLSLYDHIALDGSKVKENQAFTK